MEPGKCRGVLQTRAAPAAASPRDFQITHTGPGLDANEAITDSKPASLILLGVFATGTNPFGFHWESK